FIDAGDIAAVAGHALTDEVPHNAAHVLTGPEAVSYAEAAEIIGKWTGTPVRHRALSTEDFTRHLAASGLPVEFATFLAALDEDIRGGAEDRVTDIVEHVTGRPARGFREFVEAEIPRSA